MCFLLKIYPWADLLRFRSLVNCLGPTEGGTVAQETTNIDLEVWRPPCSLVSSGLQIPFLVAMNHHTPFLWMTVLFAYFNLKLLGLR